MAEILTPIVPQLKKYVPDLFAYRRRRTREVMVGNVGVGGQNPIRVQSMTTTDTLDALSHSLSLTLSLSLRSG